MTRTWECPFCGENRKPSKEHVWPKWLHESPGAQDLLRDSHGERQEIIGESLSVSGGRVIAEPYNASVAKWVPQITAKVCERCNNGWMSRLEERAQQLLKPVVLAVSPRDMDSTSVLLLAQWSVMKTMTYQVAMGMKQGAFTPQEFRAMATNQQVPSRCRVWIRSQLGPLQVIATHYRGGWALPPMTDLHESQLRDNLALMLIGMPHLTLYVGVAPSDELAWLIEMVVPATFGTSEIPQLWPDPRSLELPTVDDGSELFDPRDVFVFIDGLFSHEAVTEVTALTSDEWDSILAKNPGPVSWLEAFTDAYESECRADRLDPDFPDGLIISSPRPFSRQQLTRLFRAALDMAQRHRGTQPALVARRLYNLGHFLSAEGARAYSLVLLVTASMPGGGYDEREDLWRYAGSEAWHLGAFALAAEFYAKQRERDPDSHRARFTYAEARFMSGDFAGAFDVLCRGPEWRRVDPAFSLNDATDVFATTCSVVVEQLKLGKLKGFEGPSFEEIVDASLTGKRPRSSKPERMIRLIKRRLKKRRHRLSPEAAVAWTYLSEQYTVWAHHSAELLIKHPDHPCLMPVLRQCNSRDVRFAPTLFQLLSKRQYPVSLPDGSDLQTYLSAHEYRVFRPTVRTVDDQNRIIDSTDRANHQAH